MRAQLPAYRELRAGVGRGPDRTENPCDVRDLARVAHRWAAADGAARDATPRFATSRSDRTFDHSLGRMEIKQAFDRRPRPLSEPA